MSIDLSAANVVKKEAMEAWEMMKPMIQAGDAGGAWIHIAWAILAEREACAKIADVVADKVPSNDARHIDWQSGYQDGAMEVAAAIRERTNS